MNVLNCDKSTPIKVTFTSMLNDVTIGFTVKFFAKMCKHVQNLQQSTRTFVMDIWACMDDLNFKQLS